ncbi:MAG: response regulator [Bdellovibrio sp.]|nr:response regulator [Bdellovibrio sp.]
MSANLRILVIDDMAVMRKIVVKQLETMGYKNIETAENGKDALQKILDGVKNNSPVQFIVSDWNMPEMSGLELLKALRSKKPLADIPFLMVTAEGEKDQIMAAIQAGVTNYIVKPFSPATFKEKMDLVLKKVGLPPTPA